MRENIRNAQSTTIAVAIQVDVAVGEVIYALLEDLHYNPDYIVEIKHLFFKEIVPKFNANMSIECREAIPISEVYKGIPPEWRNIELVVEAYAKQNGLFKSYLGTPIAIASADETDEKYIFLRNKEPIFKNGLTEMA